MKRPFEPEYQKIRELHMPLKPIYEKTSVHISDEKVKTVEMH